MIKNRNTSYDEQITLNGIEYINKELFIESFEDRIKQHRGDWDTSSEAQDAFDVAIRVINNI